MYLTVNFVISIFLNGFHTDGIYPSKKDSDSGVGSDNGDKRLSANEVKFVIRFFSFCARYICLHS